jgi:CBS domain containing-hemolysin-like protein
LNFTSESLAALLTMLVLLAFSAFFSGAETALFSLPPDAVRRMRAHSRTEALLALLRRDPSGLLTSLLFGNLVVNVLFFCTGAEAVGRLAQGRGGWYEALGGVLVLLTVILCGEIIPKAVGIARPTAVLRLSAGPLCGWFLLTRPFRAVLRHLLERFGLHDSVTPGGRTALTPGELKELLDAVQHEPGFGSQEKEILEDIVNLSDVRVREVMVPRVRVLRRRVDADRAELLNAARRNRYSQVLIYRDREEDLIGCVSVRRLFLDGGKGASLDPLIRPLRFVPETKRVDALLREMMADNTPLAAVVDEYGGFSGLVTLEDLLAEVIGDFETADDAGIQRLDESTFRLSGQLSIRAWRELFTGFLPGQELTALTFDTLGGFIVSLLGRMPRAGDTVRIRNLELLVEGVHHRRISTVLLRLGDGEELS